MSSSLRRLDVVIPNAGIQTPAESHLSSSDDFDRVLNVNLKGYYYCAKVVDCTTARSILN